MNFVPNFRAKTSVYVPIGVDDDEDELEFVWDLWSCARDEAPLRIWEDGKSFSITFFLPADMF